MSTIQKQPANVGRTQGTAWAGEVQKSADNLKLAAATLLAARNDPAASSTRLANIKAAVPAALSVLDKLLEQRFNEPLDDAALGSLKQAETSTREAAKMGALARVPDGAVMHPESYTKMPADAAQDLLKQAKATGKPQAMPINGAYLVVTSRPGVDDATNIKQAVDAHAAAAEGGKELGTAQYGVGGRRDSEVTKALTAKTPDALKGTPQAAMWDALRQLKPDIHVSQRDDGTFYLGGLPEKKQGSMLASTRGEGASISAAVDAAFKTLTAPGERLVLGAYTPARQEVTFDGAKFVPWSFSQVLSMKTVDDVKTFAGRFKGVVDEYGKMSAQQMTDKLGPGLMYEARSAVETLLRQVGTDTAASFSPAGFAAGNDPVMDRAAVNQHSGYVAGELSRKFGVDPEAARKAVLAHHQTIISGGKGDLPALAEKLAAGAKDPAAVKAFVTSGDNGWMFGAYGFGTSDLALNRPGVHAGKATLALAEVLTHGNPDQARKLVADTLALPSDVVALALQGRPALEKEKAAMQKGAQSAQGNYAPAEEFAEKRLALLDKALALSPEQEAVVMFAARAAQLGWLTSKVGQGVVEAHNAKPEKAEKALARFAPKNDLITDFDSLAAKKGWAEVAKDIDQVKTATTFLQREGMNLRDVADPQAIKAIADGAFGKRDIRMATAGYSAPPAGYEAPTQKFMDSLVQALGAGRVGLVTSPTADAGSVDAISTKTAHKSGAAALYVTAENYVPYINPDNFPKEGFNRATYAAAPKYVFPDATAYSQATALASNVFVATGGRDATVSDFVNAVKNGNKVVLVDNAALSDEKTFDKKGRPDNAVALLRAVLQAGKLPDTLTPDQAAVLDKKGLNARFLQENAGALKSNILIARIGTDGDVTRAVADAKKFLAPA